MISESLTDCLNEDHCEFHFLIKDYVDGFSLSSCSLTRAMFTQQWEVGSLELGGRFPKPP